MSDSWKILLLLSKLRNIHPAFTHIDIVDGEILMYFFDGSPMVSCEFNYSSETRNLLDELEDIMLDDEDDE